MDSINESTALVLGARGDLGGAIATSLACEGVTLAIADNDTVAFFGSRRASYITGSIVRVDGGYIANV